MLSKGVLLEVLLESQDVLSTKETPLGHNPTQRFSSAIENHCALNLFLSLFTYLGADNRWYLIVIQAVVAIDAIFGKHFKRRG
jgi:hypothetical protein